MGIKEISLKKLPIVLFDGECALCVRFKQSVERIDSSEYLNFVSIHNEEIYQQYPELDRDQCFEKIHLIKEDQTILSGANAIEFMITHLPEVKKFSWLIESQVGKKALEFFHNTTNRLRKKLLKDCPSCNHK